MLYVEGVLFYLKIFGYASNYLTLRGYYSDLYL